MTAEGAFDKSDGDILYASEVNSMPRLIAIEQADSSHTGDTDETDMTSVLTIPANSIGTGIIIVSNAYFSLGANVNASSASFKIKADGSNPPTTVKQTQTASLDCDANGAEIAELKVGLPLMAVVTDLTANVANYVKITGTLAGTGGTMFLEAFYVMAY